MAKLRADGDFEDLSMTRRHALGAMGVGFALSMRPVSAETISTDAKGLEVADIKFKVADGTSPAFVARPKGKGPFPTILLNSEIFGLHEWVRDVARRLAHAGYGVIAPDYFYRAGDPSKITDFSEIMPIVRKETLPMQLSDASGAVAWLGEQKWADVKRLGVTGFCWGGGLTWMVSESDIPVKAAVAWYGPLVNHNPPGQGEQRPYPIDSIAKIKAPVLGLYGGLDKNITADDVAAMKKALADAGKTNCDIVVYPQADHGFNADYRPSYNAEAAKDAWGKMLAWFKANGVA